MKSATLQYETLDRTLSASFFANSPATMCARNVEADAASPLLTAAAPHRTPKGAFELLSDDLLFEQEHKRRQEKQTALELKRTQPVYAKATLAATTKASVPLDFAKAPTWRNPLRSGRESFNAQSDGAAATGFGRQPQPRERVSDLIAKKRELFLVSIGLDIKANEIDKLKQQASQRATALDKAEKLLEEDSKRFEDFLRDHAVKLQEAVARADAESKAKQEKISEIHSWQERIAGMRSELSRSEEQLEDAKRLQSFLKNLAPPEWREGLVAERDERHAARLAAWKLECESIQMAKQAAKDAKCRAQEDYDLARTQQEADRAQAEISAACTALDIANARQPPAAPMLEQLDENAVYFQVPGQLLDIFGQLEAQNLSLVQSTQQARAALEATKAKQQVDKSRLDAECKALQTQVKVLRQARDEQLQLCAALKGKGGGSASGQASKGQEKEEISQADLHGWVSEVYLQCGFAEDPQKGLVQMMAAIEQTFNGCIREAAALAPECLEDGEKAREKERRQVAREAKKLQEAEEYKAKLERAKQRAAAPIYKRQGKPTMHRSSLPKRKAVDKAKDAAKLAELEIQRYIMRPFL